eukprot:1157309-Pelagomonas_calceolata.AAC.5
MQKKNHHPQIGLSPIESCMPHIPALACTCSYTAYVSFTLPAHYTASMRMLRTGHCDLLSTSMSGFMRPSIQAWL